MNKWSAVTCRSVADRSFFDVTSEVKEILLARRQRFFRQGCNIGSWELVQVGVVVTPIG